MKKVLLLFTVSIIVLSLLFISASAAEVTVVAPTETEIMPLRDFYVIGKIDRNGATAKEQPLNLRIRLNNSMGEAVRLLESNVGPDGVTPGSYFLLDYENGTAVNDAKNVLLNTLTPPDILYDGNDRDSIRLAYNKIVVKEDYFAAIIFGGATKDFDLNLVDKYEKSLPDLISGEYELIVTALDLYGEEVFKTVKTINIGNNNKRLIATDNVNLAEYTKENDLVLPNSIVGYWNPSSFLNNVTKDFSYSVNQRFADNIKVELSGDKDVYILLNYLDTSRASDNVKLGSIFSKSVPNKVNYLYYDIGEEAVPFRFADANLEKKGKVVESKYNQFIALSRVENTNKDGEVRFIDFNLSDGVNLTVGDSGTFYGVYSPVNYKASLSGATYEFNNMVTEIRMVVSDKDGEVVFEDNTTANLVRENKAGTAQFEFSATIDITEELLSCEKPSIEFFAIDTDGEVLLKSEKTELKLVNYGEFIAGYDDSYWGKMFCDTVNSFGQSPSGKPIEADSHISRGDFAALINRLLGFSVSGKSKFSDLDENSDFYEDCITAQQIGYMTGDEKGQVHAEDLISREEAIIILARISNAEKGDVSISFKDSDNVSFWAKDYVDTMCSTGIIAGFNGYLNPTDSITVAEAAALVIKTIKWMYSPDAEIKHNDIVESDDIDFDSISRPENGFTGDFSEKTAGDFLLSHESILSAVVTYLNKNCNNGAYINKVGNGLEIRDYKLGSFIKLSDNAIELIGELSEQFVAFSVKYNPNAEDTVSFVFGKTDEGKEFGIVYAPEKIAKNKELTAIRGNWYYFIQK